MYFSEYEEQVQQRLESVLGGTYEVKRGAGDLQTEDSIKELAARVNVKPHLIINVAPLMEQIDADTTNRVSTDSVTIEILVAVENPRSKHEQKKQAMKGVFGTRAALQGYNLSSDYAATQPITFQAAQEEFNLDGLCVYTVSFNTDTTVDLDEVK